MTTFVAGAWWIFLSWFDLLETLDLNQMYETSLLQKCFSVLQFTDVYGQVGEEEEYEDGNFPLPLTPYYL